MQLITITLDGREVSGYSGMTILELANEVGVTIPTLCHDPHLSPIGACRICLVENEQNGALIASCVTPIASDMVINTKSERVLSHRKTIVKLLLASHPDSCLVCNKGNRCKLRTIASDMGIGLVEYQRITQVATIEEVNPFIERDLSKCILCARCIRACQEMVVVGAIDYYKRGFATKPATFGDNPLERSECTFCSTCLAMCPTGALTEKGSLYNGTTSHETQTICPLCGCGCAITLEVKDDQMVRTLPGSTGVNQGALCVKGSRCGDMVHNANRLTVPLIKQDGDFKQASWDEVLDIIANKFKQIKNAYGADSLGVIISAMCTNEENYLVQRFARCVLGTNNIDSSARLYNAATFNALNSTIGFYGANNNLDKLEQSDVIFVIGADPDASAPIVAYAIKRAVKHKGAKLILVDPRKTGLSDFSYIWLRPKPGTDVALINAMAKIITDAQLVDEEYVLRSTDNFDDFKNCLNQYTSEYVESICSVDGKYVGDAARLYAEASHASIVWGTGLTQYAGGADSVKSLVNLALLTGHIGLSGALYALEKGSNSRGALDMGTTTYYLPGCSDVSDNKARSNFEQAWKVSLPTKRGLTALEMMQQAEKGTVKGMLIVGENPVLSFPNGQLVTKALSTLEFLAVGDMFISDTAELASIVFPTTSFAEQSGTFTNFEGRVGFLHQAISCIGVSQPGWETILKLAEKMGSPMPFSTLQDVSDEIETLVPTYKAYTGPDKLYDSELVDWEMKHVQKSMTKAGFPSFCTIQNIPEMNGKSENYPYKLIIASSLYHTVGGSGIFNNNRLKSLVPFDFVDLAIQDASEQGITTGDRVRLVSPTGEITVTARIVDSVPKGVIWLSFLHTNNPLQLFDIVLDKETKTPLTKACNVQIEKVVSHE